MNEKSLKQELQEKLARIEQSKQPVNAKKPVTMEELRKRYENEPQQEQQPELPVEKNESSVNKKNDTVKPITVQITKDSYLQKLEKELEKSRKAGNKSSASKIPVSNKQKNHIGFTKATVLLPDKLQTLLKKKAKADGMDYHDALKILAHRYVAGVIELDANDAPLVDKYYK